LKKPMLAAARALGKHTAPKRPAKFTLVCAMRNEGPYILEWLAWHRAVGFDDILIISNDCTDGSDILLRHLAARGMLLHIEHSPRADQYALKPAHALALNHPAVRGANWVMVLDADEFLVVHIGDNTVQGLIRANGQNCLGMAVHWKCFGDSGQLSWRDAMVREQFTRCTAPADPVNANFKSLFREPTQFKNFSSHAPNDYQGMWGGKNRWVDSMGRVLSGIQLLGPKPRCATRISRITHEAAQINHYVIKSQENMVERRIKWANFNNAERYNADFIKAHNKNDFEDTSALKNTTCFATQYNTIRHDPETLRLHHACCANYSKMLVEKQGREPGEDPRYQMHRAKSQ